MASRQRIAWIEWVRALGAVSIVLLHVFVSTGNAMDMSAARELSYTVLGITLCRWAVPGFFMVSGLLLLDPHKEVGWPQVAKYVRRMLIVLATFGLLFALMQEVVGLLQAGMPLGIGFAWEALWRAVVDVLTARTWDHLWYVYALTGAYILTPALRWCRERLGDWGFLAFTCVLIIGVLVVPTLLGVVVPNLLIGLACYCLGGCLRRLRFGPWVMVLGVASLATMLAVSVLGILRGDGDQNYIFLQGSCFACWYALMILMLFRHRLGDKRIDSSGTIARLAQDSFGVYIVHPLFIHLVLMAVDPMAMPPVLFEALFFAGTLVVSIASTRLLRRVPLFRGVL